MRKAAAKGARVDDPGSILGVPQSSLSTYLESSRRPLGILLAEDRCPASQRLHSESGTKHDWLL